MRLSDKDNSMDVGVINRLIIRQIKNPHSWHSYARALKRSRDFQPEALRPPISLPNASFSLLSQSAGENT